MQNDMHDWISTNEMAEVPQLSLQGFEGGGTTQEICCPKHMSENWLVRPQPHFNNESTSIDGSLLANQTTGVQPHHTPGLVDTNSGVDAFTNVGHDDFVYNPSLVDSRTGLVNNNDFYAHNGGTDSNPVRTDTSAGLANPDVNLQAYQNGLVLEHDVPSNHISDGSFDPNAALPWSQNPNLTMTAVGFGEYLTNSSGIEEIENDVAFAPRSDFSGPWSNGLKSSMNGMGPFDGLDTNNLSSAPGGNVGGTWNYDYSAIETGMSSGHMNTIRGFDINTLPSVPGSNTGGLWDNGHMLPMGRMDPGNEAAVFNNTFTGLDSEVLPYTSGINSFNFMAATGAASPSPTLTITINLIPCTYADCTKLFKRDYERLRHVNSVHVVRHGLYLCPVPNCVKGIGRGYSRRDKVYEHLWRKHSNLGFTRRV